MVGSASSSGEVEDEGVQRTKEGRVYVDGGVEEVGSGVGVRVEEIMRVGVGVGVHGEGEVVK